jgi:hypothetical protein
MINKARLRLTIITFYTRFRAIETAHRSIGRRRCSARKPRPGVTACIYSFPVCDFCHSGQVLTDSEHPNGLIPITHSGQFRSGFEGGGQMSAARWVIVESAWPPWPRLPLNRERLGGAAVADHAADPCRRRTAVRRLCRTTLEVINGLTGEVATAQLFVSALGHSMPRRPGRRGSPIGSARPHALTHSSTG